MNASAEYKNLKNEERRLRKAIKREFSIGEAAEALGVPIVTLRYWIDHGTVEGVYITPGKHRWITRSGLLRLAHKKGIRSAFAMERRRARRVRARKIPIHLETHYPGVKNPIGVGEGRLWDLSATGFRADRVRWRGKYLPSRCGEFRFEIGGSGPVSPRADGKKDTRYGPGNLAGAAGKGRIAWLLDNREERGITLGARVKRFQGAQAERIWRRYIRKRAAKVRNYPAPAQR